MPGKRTAKRAPEPAEVPGLQRNDAGYRVGAVCADTGNVGKAEGKAKLTPKQAAFVREYLIDKNATQAAIRAGYNARTANKTGPRLLVNVGVAAEIAKRQAKLEERAGVNAEAVIRELALLGFANMQDYMRVTPDGDAYVDLSSLTQEQAAAVQEVTVDEYTEGRGDDKREVKRVRIKLADKRTALVDLGKHLGLFEREPGASNQVVITHDGGAPMSPTVSGDGGNEASPQSFFSP